MLSKKWITFAQDLSKESRSYRKFFHAMKTDSTISLYAYSMKRFMDFLHSEKYVDDPGDYDKLLDFDTEKITDVLEDFVYHLNSTQKPKGVTTLLAGPELFFEMNRKIWHKKLVRKSIKKDDVESGGKVPISTEEIKTMLDCAKHPRDKALVHFLASTGARPAGLHDPILRMKHLTYMPNPNNPNHEQHWCYAVKIYDESKEGYWTFLTPEATLSLNRYFGWRKHIRKEEFDDETPIFATFSRSAKERHLGIHGMKQIFRNLINRSNLQRVKKGNRYDKAQNYMFRKRFNTILKLNNDVNSNIAEKLMAHKRGLDGTYLQPTKEECYREFVKAISQLTIDPTERQKATLEEKQEKIDQLEATVQENSELKKKLDEQEDRVTKLEEMLFDSNFHPISKSG
ncbi:MAG: hypothetical protein OEL84_01645 [Nitrosopumilus sp.]|nr:hypothetical protein [Nitrosopumilus sp.]